MNSSYWYCGMNATIPIGRVHDVKFCLLYFRKYFVYACYFSAFDYHIYIYIYRERERESDVMAILNNSFRICALFVSGFACCAAGESQLGTVCEKCSTMTQFTPPGIWNRHVVLRGIHAKIPIGRVHSV